MKNIPFRRLSEKRLMVCFLYGLGFSVKCANEYFSNPRQMSIGAYCQIPVRSSNPDDKFGYIKIEFGLEFTAGISQAPIDICLSWVYDTKNVPLASPLSTVTFFLFKNKKMFPRARFATSHEMHARQYIISFSKLFFFKRRNGFL
jgi:predicted Na+-dependent transporter